MLVELTLRRITILPLNPVDTPDQVLLTYEYPQQQSHRLAGIYISWRIQQCQDIQNTGTGHG